MFIMILLFSKENRQNTFIFQFVDKPIWAKQSINITTGNIIFNQNIFNSQEIYLVKNNSYKKILIGKNVFFKKNTNIIAPACETQRSPGG